MRVLLMISNSNMPARELYGRVLRDRHPAWGISNMSGLPISPATIMKGFDVVVYDLGAADDPRRYRAVLALWAEVKDPGTQRMSTHVGGPYRGRGRAPCCEALLVGHHSGPGPVRW